MCVFYYSHAWCIKALPSGCFLYLPSILSFPFFLAFLDVAMTLFTVYACGGKEKQMDWAFLVAHGDRMEEGMELWNMERATKEQADKTVDVGIFVLHAMGIFSQCASPCHLCLSLSLCLPCHLLHLLVSPCLLSHGLKYYQ